MTAIAACRTCGTEPLEHARFCHGCGAPVQDAGIRAEYKQVTVLFADVVHSMDIAAAVGSAGVVGVVRLAVGCCSVRSAVRRTGITLDYRPALCR